MFDIFVKKRTDEDQDGSIITVLPYFSYLCGKILVLCSSSNRDAVPLVIKLKDIIINYAVRDIFIVN